MPTLGGSTAQCPKCSKAIYAVEQVIGPGDKFYHRACLTCTSCNKRLESSSLLEHDELPYCKSCHNKEFGIADLRSSPSVSGKSNSVIRSQLSTPSSTPNSSPSRWGGGGTKCNRCEKTVYFAEETKAVGKTWHKACLRCTECNKTLDPGRLSDRDGAPHCNPCYTKLYGAQIGRF